MNKNILNSPIGYLQGVGPQRAEILKNELNIYTFKDLVNYFPFRFIDKSKYYKTNEVSEKLNYVQIVGTLSNFKEIKQKRGSRLTAEIIDEEGKIELVWFKNTKWIKKGYNTSKKYVVFGKPNLFGSKINIIHPEMELLIEHKSSIQGGMKPVYHSSEKLNSKGLNSNGISKLQRKLIPEIIDYIPENLSEKIINEHKLISKKEAIKSIHFPSNSINLQKAQFRLKFEELFFIQLSLLKNKLINKEKSKGFVFNKVSKNFNLFFNQLDFELTNAQKRVTKEIRKDLNSGKQMNRLLQGDVGSGKTVVALMSILIAIDNGYQACLMAPTEILAVQHFKTITEFLSHSSLNIKLLTGSTTKSKKINIIDSLKNGTIDIIIGTHALIEPNIAFLNLGVVIIDEQHRFGVEQRAKLWKKNSIPPHILVMTATPIPRTLAMTLYGDLDISIIDELPPNRKPIKTLHIYDNKRLQLIAFMKEQIQNQNQIYVVYPLIEESDTLDYNFLMDGYASLERDFPKPNYQISVVHGKMKAEDKEFELQRFIRKETQIMIATTVIEVGIDVPNANVMIIESAERFGLSQLHQLRGRVGRGAQQAYCVLMSSFKLTDEAKIRLTTMARTNDGFEIADTDLKLRGPGDLMGTKQSGILNLKIADLAKDTQILKLARFVASKILKKDKTLSQEKNKPIYLHYKDLEKDNFAYGRIS